MTGFETGLRHSHMELEMLYFWTATINQWQRLLQSDRYKDEIIGSLRTLSDRELIDVFGFAIMPNHIHLIWNAKQLNGKESPQGSFLKFTAHQFKKMLISDGDFKTLRHYEVDRINKQYEFWQRDPMAIPLYSRAVAIQKLNYIHNNPLTERWQLAATPEAYKYSSASYYETGVDDFGFLKNLHDERLMGLRGLP